MTDYINEPGVWFDSKGKCIDINDVIRACKEAATALISMSLTEKIKGTPVEENFKRYAEIIMKIEEAYFKAGLAEWKKAQMRKKITLAGKSVV